MNVSVIFTRSSCFCASLATTSLMNWIVMIGMLVLSSVSFPSASRPTACRRRPARATRTGRTRWCRRRRSRPCRRSTLPSVQRRTCDDLDVELLLAVGPLALVAGDVGRPVALDDDADGLHVEGATGQRPDLAHEAEELVEAVVPAGQVVVAGHLPDHLLCPELGDDVAIAGREGLVGARDAIGGDVSHAPTPCRFGAGRWDPPPWTCRGRRAGRGSA